MPQLDIATFLPQLFWLFISFVLLYFLLSKFCLPKLSAILEQREARIMGNLNAAKAAKEESYKLKQEYDLILAKALKEKNDIFSKATKEMSELMDKKMSDLDLEMESLIKNSEERLKNFKQEANLEINKISEEIALEIITKLGVQVDKASVAEALRKAETEGSYVI